MVATHMRIRNKVKVNVERHEGGTLVVRNMRGKVLGSYTREQLQTFNKRYKSLAVKGRKVKSVRG